VAVTDADVRARIVQIASAELGLDPAALEALGTGDLARHLDSVQRLTLVVAIEDAFQICLDPDDEAELVRLDDVVRLVRSRATEP